MATASLVDYLSEKIYSLSSKMWGISPQSSSTSFLMGKNSNLQSFDLSSVLGEVRDKTDYQIAINPTYQFLPLHRFTTGILGGLKLLNGMNKPNYMNMTEKGFTPHLFISDSHRSKYGPYDSSLMSPDSKFLNSAIESLHSESYMINQKTDTMKREVCNPQVIEMTVDVSPLPIKEKTETIKENCDISPTVRLNLELAHRKTKEMSKRSKKRRRRQKKSEQLNVSNSTSASEDEDANNECLPIKDSVCFLSKSPDFGCTLSIHTHTIQLSPRNSFLIPVQSDSEDDSEWETFEDIEISAANNESSNEKSSGDSSASSNSSPIKFESLKSSSFKPSVHVSSIISFVVPEDDSDDDSDWDTCETSTFPENTDFELSGLYFTNLCTPPSYFKSDCNSGITSETDSEEKLQQRADILEANSKWNNLNCGQTSNSISKVTFAPDENLVEVFLVEIFERKGEWEMYATARDRFKRKISELEKVISPCLMPEHRSKIFKKFIKPEL